MDAACANMSVGETSESRDDVDGDQMRLVIDEMHSNSPSSSSAKEEMKIENIKTEITEDITPVRTPERSESSAKKAAAVVKQETFSWPEYLKETGAVAAPEDCFFQAPVPPINRFEVGKKVEVPDPRGNEVQCLATVMSVHSVWICLRLDGEDASNDQWLICDDSRILPVGESEKNGSSLQPPYGFMYNLASFHKFIENQLKIEEDGSNPVAPLESFCPISIKYHPRRNKFEVGMKCEAIDQKNFNGRPCPATVVAVDDDYVTINYDGWNQAYDTKERFDSRYIFPVGWSAKVGLEVQPPKRTKGKVKPPVLRRPASQKKSPAQPAKTTVHKEPAKRRSAAPVSNTPPVRRPKVTPKTAPSAPSGEVRHQKMQQDSRVAIVSPLGGSVASKEASSSKENGDHKTEGGSSSQATSPRVKVEPMNGDVHPAGGDIPSKPRAKKTIANGTGGRQEQPPSKKARILSAKIKHESDRASTGTPKSSLSSPAAPDIVLSTPESQGHPENLKMTVYINKYCRCTPLLDPEKVHLLQPQIGPGCLHHVLREIIQQVVNCAAQPSTVFKRIEPGTPRIISITAEIGGLTHVRAIPTSKSIAGAWTYLRGFLGKLDVCPNFISDKPVVCPNCEPVHEEAATGSSRQSSQRHMSESGDSDDSEENLTGGGAHAECPLSSWTVEQVSAEIESSFGPTIASRFLQNQIDGKAMSLLNTDLVMQYLDLPFGPALKMMSYVESLKNKYRRMTPSSITDRISDR